MNRAIALMLVAAALLFIHPDALSQMELGSGVIASGGGRVQDALYTHSCTAGQPAVGIVSGVQGIHAIGFWYAAPTPPSEVPCPQIEPPAEYALRAGLPGGRGPSTSIAYAAPVAGHVTIRIHDVTGRVTRTLIDAVVAPGRYTVPLDGANQAAGVYFCRMDASDFTAVKKLVLIR